MSSFVLYLFYKERSSIKIAHKYIISMAINDLLLGFICISLAIYFFRIEVYSSLMWCQINTAFSIFMQINSLMTILIASIDRIIICAWSFSVIVSASTFVFSDGRHTLNGVCRFKTYFLTIISSVIAPICIISIAVFYYLIHEKLKNTLYDGIDFERKRENVFKQMFVYLKTTTIDKKCNTQLTRRRKNDMKILKREIKTTILLFLTVTAAIIIIIPCLITLAIFRIFPVLMDVRVLFSCAVLYLLHPIFNSILYVYGIPNIRKRGKITLMQILNHPRKNDMFEFDESTQKSNSMKSSSQDQLSHKSLMV
uniref:CSON014240 protein n=1 Tax=Culicoides sonorensis TaxID=179676 RepID=A0A336M9Z7_CULSO